jgi:hypothetical protein
MINETQSIERPMIPRPTAAILTTKDTTHKNTARLVVRARWQTGQRQYPSPLGMSSAC